MKRTVLNKYLEKDFLYDELLCGFVSFTPDGKILSINKTMASWVGIDFQAIQDRNFKSLMTKSSMLYYNMVVDPMLNLKPVVNEISLKFKSEAGSFDALLNAESYRNEQGNLILINATIQKITDRKRYENELLREKRSAEERFVTMATNQSHMIRKPLANILGLAQLLQDENGSPEFKKILDMLLESVQELDTMIRQANTKNML